MYADQLVRLIKEELPDTPFAICLNGGWGEGKTSLLKRVYNRLREDKDEKFKVLWFNAWQYERLDPVLALLQKIANEYGDRAKKLNDVIKGLGLVFLDVVSRKTIGLNLDDIKKRFESSVKEIQTINETLEDLIGIDRKLIIFVDDLDRCSIDNTNNILESIKLLFSAKNTKFVVGADMKMLETAWALKHKPLIESPYQGREHLEKIFQLKLSLQPKAFMPSIEFLRQYSYPGLGGIEAENVNEAMSSYVSSLVSELPRELKDFIANAFPPNPRKIKRALSLAYFVGKNLEGMDDSKFKLIFAVLLFWVVAATYFPTIANLAKTSPRYLWTLFDLVERTPDIGFLREALDSLKDTRVRVVNADDRSLTPQPGEEYRKVISGTSEMLLGNVWLIDFAKENIVNNRLMHRFLKASNEFLDKIEDENIYSYVFEKAGLIS